MNLGEFNDNYLNILLQKNSKEKKNVFLLGNFNVDLLKYDKHAGTNGFIDSLSSYMYLPYILHPARVTSHSQTIIDNIFSNYVSKEAVCGNLTSTIFDHLPQVLFIPSMFSGNPATKSNIFERSWKNVNQAEFLMDYFCKDWSNILNLKHGNVNVSMENFVNNMNDLLDKHVPFKKISKYKLKFKTKPWITPALQKSISIKNALFKRYIKLKSPVKKNEVHQQYKYYRNLLSTFMKKRKQNYYERFFKNNLNNLRNIWKGIRSLIAIKHSSASNIHMLTHKGATVTDPLHIANINNNYFSPIAEKTKANIKFSNKSFQDFLHHPNEESLFITPTDAHEVNLTISSLNSDKSTGPTSLPTNKKF